MSGRSTFEGEPPDDDDEDFYYRVWCDLEWTDTVRWAALAKAQEIFAKKYFKRIVTMLRKRRVPAADAEDDAQELLIRLMKAMKAMKPDGNLYPYFCGMVYHHIIDRARKSKPPSRPFDEERASPQLEGGLEDALAGWIDWGRTVQMIVDTMRRWYPEQPWRVLAFRLRLQEWRWTAIRHELMLRFPQSFSETQLRNWFLRDRTRLRLAYPNLRRFLTDRDSGPEGGHDGGLGEQPGEGTG